MQPAYLYLHGFASGPSSTKAHYLGERFRPYGIELEVPELDEGRFEQMTITSQLGVVDRAIDGRPAVLLGSSLGGWIAALYASTHPNVERVVLMAPAFGFVSLFRDMTGERAMREWKVTGVLPAHHYGANAERRLSFDFITDAAKHEQFPGFPQLGLILHGNKDEAVPVEHSIRYAGEHQNVTLVRLDSGHELTDVLPTLWSKTASFLGLERAAGTTEELLRI